MNGSVMFLDCPAYMDAHGAVRCGLPAAVEDRYTAESTDGPLESARIRCPRGHFFNGPVEFLTWERSSQPARSVRRHRSGDLRSRPMAADRGWLSRDSRVKLSFDPPPGEAP